MVVYQNPARIICPLNDAWLISSAHRCGCLELIIRLMNRQRGRGQSQNNKCRKASPNEVGGLIQVKICMWNFLRSDWCRITDKLIFQLPAIDSQPRSICTRMTQCATTGIWTPSKHTTWLINTKKKYFHNHNTETIKRASSYSAVSLSMQLEK